MNKQNKKLWLGIVLGSSALVGASYMIVGNKGGGSGSYGRSAAMDGQGRDGIIGSNEKGNRVDGGNSGGAGNGITNENGGSGGYAGDGSTGVGGRIIGGGQVGHGVDSGHGAGNGITAF